MHRFERFHVLPFYNVAYIATTEKQKALGIRTALFFSYLLISHAGRK